MKLLSDRIENLLSPEQLEELIEIEESAEDARDLWLKLEVAVDKLAAIGVIDSNPHSKFLYIEGDRLLTEGV